MQCCPTGLTDLSKDAILESEYKVDMDVRLAPKVALVLGGSHASTNEWGGESSSSDDEMENEVNNNNSARSMLDVARPGDGHVSKVVSAGTGMLLE